MGKTKKENTLQRERSSGSPTLEAEQ